MATCASTAKASGSRAGGPPDWFRSLVATDPGRSAFKLDLGPPVARIRVSHSNDRGPVGQLIWQSILSNRDQQWSPPIAVEKVVCSAAGNFCWVTAGHTCLEIVICESAFTSFCGFCFPVASFVLLAPSSFARLARVMLAQFRFPSPFARAFLASPPLLQEALDRLNIGPFQADGEFLCLLFLSPSRDEPDDTGVTLRSWSTFRRVLEGLQDHSENTKSVTPRTDGLNGCKTWTIRPLLLLLISWTLCGASGS